MTHEDAWNYSAKREGAQLDEDIAAAIKEKAADNKISCAEAHAIAIKLQVTPAEVGTAIDLLEMRINKCQLGLFGYKGKTNFPEIPDDINPDIKSAISLLVKNEHIPSAAAWDIAKKFKISKATVSAVCNSMKVKISACQLGAFR